MKFNFDEECIYLIEMLELDSLENEVSRALTWKIVGYKSNKMDAIRIVEQGGFYDKKECWALTAEKTPKLKYTQYNHIFRGIK